MSWSKRIAKAMSFDTRGVRATGADGSGAGPGIATFRPFLMAK
jgi:hypothetical protein